MTLHFPTPVLSLVMRGDLLPPMPLFNIAVIAVANGPDGGTQTAQGAVDCTA